MPSEYCSLIGHLNGCEFFCCVEVCTKILISLRAYKVDQV